MENSQVKWIAKELLEQILVKNYREFEQPIVRKFYLEPATKKGQNYASEMYRVFVKFETRQSKVNEISIILKMMPTNKVSERIMVQNNIYPREISIYSDLLPRIYQLLQSIGDHSTISPRCLHTALEPTLYLVFEDIKRDNYEMIDGKFGLDLDRTKVILSKIARLHACSAVIYDRDPSSMDNHREGCISSNPERQEFLKCFVLFSRIQYKMVKKWSETESDWIGIAEKLRTLERRIVQNAIKMFDHDPNEFNVFNHSDLWCNNFMFKYDGNKVLDALIFDYQLSSFGSPGIDLNFFFHLAVQARVRREWMIHLIQQYHGILVNILRELNYCRKIPSLQDIHISMIKTGFQRVLIIIALLPLSMVENVQNANMELFLQETPAGEAFRNELIHNPRYIKLARKYFKEIDLMGYLD